MAPIAKPLFTLKRTDTTTAVTIAADTWTCEGTPAGWLVEFLEWEVVDGDEFLTPRRTYAIPASVTWEVVEEEVSAAPGRVH